MPILLNEFVLLKIVKLEKCVGREELHSDIHGGQMCDTDMEINFHLNSNRKVNGNLYMITHLSEAETCMS